MGYRQLISELHLLAAKCNLKLINVSPNFTDEMNESHRKLLAPRILSFGSILELTNPWINPHNILKVDGLPRACLTDKASAVTLILRRIDKSSSWHGEHGHRFCTKRTKSKDEKACDKRWFYTRIFTNETVRSPFC